MSDWDTILDEMYDDLEPITIRKRHSSSRRSMLNSMTKAGLVEKSEDYDIGDQGMWTFEISEEGMQVAHERHIARNQQLLNYGLVIFTVALVFSGLIQYFPQELQAIIAIAVLAIVGISFVALFGDRFDTL